MRKKVAPLGMFGPVMLGLVTLFFAVDVYPTSPTAIYWISPDGNDSNAGTESAPWLTWEKALTEATPGTLVKAKAGTWAASACESTDPQPCAVSPLPKVSCDAAVEPNWPIGVDGTAANPIVIEAQVERGVKLKGEGRDYAFAMAACDYWTIYGFLMTGGDLASGSGGFNRSNFYALQGGNLILRRNMFMYNNRYFNSHLVNFSQVTDSLLEENEGYYYHRHAFSFNSSDRITTKRNYLNSRNHADISGGYASHDNAPNWGDESIVHYFSEDGRAYNNIMENSEGLSASGSFNIFEGNITNGGTFGVYIIANCQDQTDAGVPQPCDTALDRHPVMNEVRNHLAMDTTYAGVWCKTAGCLIEDTTVVDSDLWAYRIEDDRATAGYDTRAFIRDSISVNSVQRGFEVIPFEEGNDQEEVLNWRMDNILAFEYGVETHMPNPDVRATNVYDEDPRIGTCRVYTPENSRARALGMGANIILTKEGNRMWNATTGAFMWCGAIIPGLNDIEGESCFDVHERLNIGIPTCPVPASSLQP